MDFFKIVLFSLSISSLAYAQSAHDLDPAYFDDDLPRYKIETTDTSIRYSDENYIPSNLTSMADAQKLMNRLKDNLKSNSQCFQRAHLWSMEMNQMAKIRSQKVFLFFTEKYRYEFGFHWWFHVAPFVLINGEEYVIDPRFFDKPVDMQTWSNFFMPSHPVCKTLSNYRNYKEYDEYCYLRKLPMYYFEPTEVEGRDFNSIVINDWIEAQVYSGYNALKNAPWWKR